MRIDEHNRILIPVADLVPAVFSRNWYKSATRKDRKKIDTVVSGGDRAGRGRPVDVVYDTLCDKYKAQITATLGDPREITGLVPATREKSTKKAVRIPFNELNNKEFMLCNARYNIVKSFREYAEQNGAEMGIVAAKEDFIQMVQSGYLCEDSYKVVGNMSFKTVERWNKELREGGDKMDALAPLRVQKSGTSITPEQQKLLIEEYCKDSQPSFAVTYRMACRLWRTQGTSIENLPTLSACRRFLGDWAVKNKRVATFRRRGLKVLTDSVLPSLERNPDSIQYLDCLVADGKVLNFQVVNPHTGKLCRPTLIGWMDCRTLQILGFELMVTENTLAVASSFRHACINAGRLLGIEGAILPKAVYMDNGSAFKNKFFNTESNLETKVGGMFERLKDFGLEKVIYARPYNAKTKSIERAWQSFTEMEQLADTYVGDCLANKPAALMRNEKYHKARRDGNIAKNGHPTLWGAYLAIEWAVTEYNNTIGNGKYLDGTTPNLMASEQVTQIDVGRRVIKGAELDCMIMHSKTLKLTKNGFKINGTSYYNPEFADHIGNGEEYIVRYDLKTTERILIFREDGSYWCEAGVFFGSNLHAFAALGSDADRSKVKGAQKKQSDMIKNTVKQAKQIGEGVQHLPELPTFTAPSALPSASALMLPESAESENGGTKLRLFNH